MSPNRNSKLQSLSSSQNPKYQVWQSLLKTKGLREHGLHLVSGKRIVTEYLLTKPDSVSALLLSSAHPAIFEQLKLVDVPPCFELSSSLFKELDIFGTDHPLLVVKTPTLNTWSLDLSASKDKLQQQNNYAQGFASECGAPATLQTHFASPPQVVLALSDPHNLGAAIRTCVGLGISNIVLTREACHPFLPKVTRAAVGAQSELNIEITTLSLAELTLPNAWALAADGVPMDSLKSEVHAQKLPSFVLIGEEGLGMPRHLPAQRISLPMSPRLESYNAVVAMSLFLFWLKLESGAF